MQNTSETMKSTFAANHLILRSKQKVGKTTKNKRRKKEMS